MQFDGFAVEKWRAQFTGAIEIDEREGMAMRTDKVVVMVVATRIRKSIPEPLDEDGTMRITRQNRIEHLAVLEGDLREQALSLLATGSERGFQGTLLVGLESDADPETGEIRSGMASYAAPLAPAPVTTPPTPAELLDEGDMDTHPLAHTSGQDTDYEALHDPDLVPHDNDSIPPQNDAVPEYFDVPPIVDNSQPVGTGPVKQPGARSNGSTGGDGFKVAPVDYNDLASVNTPGAPSGGPGVPVGEVVGQVRGPRKDKELEAFFNEEIEPT